MELWSDTEVEKREEHRVTNIVTNSFFYIAPSLNVGQYNTKKDH